jgi:pimeloyl-ACP methyl ester carboxylesterase
MASLLLIHGAWQGAWCWREVVARLEERGHQAIAIDLPGHGEDRSPPETVTLQDYVDRMIQAVSASKDRPILVGHSMGLIGLTAETVPDSIAALVYVAALVPPSGCSMMHFVSGFDPQYLAQFQWAPDRRTALISLEGVREFLYSCCPPEVVESAFARFTPEPVAPFETPFSTTQERFGRVPRYYIECLRDRVVPLALQRAMRTGVPFQGVYSLDTDHSPFFSAPQELATILHRIAEKA